MRTAFRRVYHALILLWLVPNFNQGFSFLSNSNLKCLLFVSDTMY